MYLTKTVRESRLRFRSHLWIHTQSGELIASQSNEGNLLCGVS